MCGRAAQTIRAVMAASSSLASNEYCRGSPVDNIGRRVNADDGHTNGDNSSYTADNQEAGSHSELGPEDDDDDTFPWRDNFNLSPGHDAVVFTLDGNSDDGPLLKMDRKKWGLVTKGGTSKSPIPEGPSKHFANLMFNARSDTLFSKPTFAKLLNEQKTCLVAVDGFFEWKTDPLGGGKGKKQPYFVFRKDNEKEGNQQSTQNMNRPYLLMAGLWTSVPTGYSPPQPSTLDTFTILTTEVCDPLNWLHSRMPVCIWDEDLAWKWLQEPSQKVHQQMDNESHRTKEYLIQWHAVTTEMSSTRYRGPDSIKALPKPKSIKSFFSPATQKTTGTAPSATKEQKATSNSGVTKDTDAGAKNESSMASPKAKRPAPSNSAEKKLDQNKRTKRGTPDPKKKGTITSFFAPKQS